MLTTPDHDDALSSRPTVSPVGPKPRGYYGDCDSATGQEGTTFRAEDFNELIDNLRQLVFAAAAVTPAKGSATMLKAALDRLYAGAVHTVVTSTTLTPDHAGLVIVDATSNAIDLTMPAAAACPLGSPMLTFVRTDTTTNPVRLIAGAGDVIVRGTLPLTVTDPIMLRSDGVLRWHLVSGRDVVLRGAFTLNVDPVGGADTPIDPLGGNAFKTLPQAMTYLNRFVLAQGTTVLINVVAATHVLTAPLDLTHPQGLQITIQGASSATTILRFDGVDGITTNYNVPTLTKLTIRGNGGTLKNGVGVAGQATFLADVVVESWTNNGISVQPNGYMVVKAGETLTVRNCAGFGIYVATSGFLEASSANTSLVLNNNGGTTVSNLHANGGLSIYSVTTTGGLRGVTIEGSAAGATIRNMDIRGSSDTTAAVLVQYMALLKGFGTGAWLFCNVAGTVYHGMKAFYFSNVSAEGIINTNCKPLLSPAQNTLGNVQSYIQVS